MLYLCILLCFVFFAGVAMTVNEGLWNNMIALLAIIFGGLLAVPWGLALGKALLDQIEPKPEYRWAFIFAAVWLVFVVSLLLFRSVAGQLSQVRMRFIKPVEMLAGPLTGLLVAMMFTSFVALTLWLPILNKQWDLKDAADWQKSTVQYLTAPFANVLGAFYLGKTINPEDLLAGAKPFELPDFSSPA